MKLKFTKMHGAGNDFIVLDATQAPLNLDVQTFRHLANRHFGIGADQVLIVMPPPEKGVDFGYRIINTDGSEAPQCGNGARCFMRYIHEKGLSKKNVVKIRTLSGDITLELMDNGLVKVNMGAPVFELTRIPFTPGTLKPLQKDLWQQWPLPFEVPDDAIGIEYMVVSMGNPHAIIRVDDINTAPVVTMGPKIENLLSCFPERVNVGFMQIISRTEINTRVYERGAGETQACGTGICAAVVCGIRMGWLDESVQAHAKGGDLHIHWQGISKNLQEPVWMYGPAEIVYEGEIEL